MEFCNSVKLKYPTGFVLTFNMKKCALKQVQMPGDKMLES